MYSNGNDRVAPQVTFARTPVQAVSLWERYDYVKPIDRIFKGSKGGAPVDFVPV